MSSKVIIYIIIFVQLKQVTKYSIYLTFPEIALMYFPIEETTFAEHIDAWLSDCRAFKCTGKPRKLRRVTFSLFEKNIITSMIFGKEGKGTKETTKKRPARK